MTGIEEDPAAPRDCRRGLCAPRLTPLPSVRGAGTPRLQEGRRDVGRANLHAESRKMVCRFAHPTSACRPCAQDVPVPRRVTRGRDAPPTGRAKGCRACKLARGIPEDGVQVCTPYKRLGENDEPGPALSGAEGMKDILDLLSGDRLFAPSHSLGQGPGAPAPGLPRRRGGVKTRGRNAPPTGRARGCRACKLARGIPEDGVQVCTPYKPRRERVGAGPCARPLCRGARWRKRAGTGTCPYEDGHGRPLGPGPGAPAPSLPRRRGGVKTRGRDAPPTGRARGCRACKLARGIPEDGVQVCTPYKRLGENA